MIEVHRAVVVAVDGPSGSGKSTVCREVARRAGLAYLDTGAMYRAVTWACLRDGVDVDDPGAVLGVARAVTVDLSTDPESPLVRVDGTEVTLAIRSPEVTAAVSAVAGHPAVREILVARQRAVIEAAGGGCVAEGRDVTTVVAPGADVRILLTASTEARLARRALQLHGTDSVEALEAAYSGVVDRDRLDASVTSFLSAADAGVVEIDSSAQALDDTVDAVLALVEVARRRAVPAGSGAGAPAAAGSTSPAVR